MRERAVLKRCLGESWLTLFPLASEREAIGVLELHTNAEPRAAQLRMVGSVLRIYNNFLGLLDYSERDTLTGLLNRKTFDESFLKAAGETGTSAPPAATEQPAQERRHVGEGSGYWLGVIDIDHFKQVNDRFGHLIGDEVLLLLSRLMRSCFRFHDRLYRFGGEEFVALVRCPDEASAVQAFERLRRTAAQYLFPQVGHISVSVGLTRVRSGDTPTTAFARADRAVYHAKNAGRDQVCSYAALVAAGQIVEHEQANAIELF
jgi:diguanylate cyclase (GGDEF)-like protein